jgi:hypothetical protein
VHRVVSYRVVSYRLLPQPGPSPQPHLQTGSKQGSVAQGSPHTSSSNWQAHLPCPGLTDPSSKPVLPRHVTTAVASD